MSGCVGGAGEERSGDGGQLVDWGVGAEAGGADGVQCWVGGWDSPAPQGPEQLRLCLWGAVHSTRVFFNTNIELESTKLGGKAHLGWGFGLRPLEADGR